MAEVYGRCGFCDAVALKEYKRVYGNVLAVEKKLDNAKKHLVS